MLQSPEPSANFQKPAAVSASSEFMPGFAPAMAQATLGASVVVRGEVTGAQTLFVDGRVEGAIRFPGNRVTIGRGGVALASIEAKEVVIMGTVTGNIDCTERVDIRCDAVLTGDVLTQRISIDEGAWVKGNVEIRSRHKQGYEDKPKVKSQAPLAAEPQVRQASAAAGPTSALPSQPTVEAAAVPKSTSRVPGSSVLYEEKAGGSR